LSGRLGEDERRDKTGSACDQIGRLDAFARQPNASERNGSERSGSPGVREGSPVLCSGVAGFTCGESAGVGEHRVLRPRAGTGIGPDSTEPFGTRTRTSWATRETRRRRMSAEADSGAPPPLRQRPAEPHKTPIRPRVDTGNFETLRCGAVSRVQGPGHLMPHGTRRRVSWGTG